MINRAIVIRGKTWGARLQRRLNKPPVGITQWIEQHTTSLRNEGGRYLGHYFMRDMSCYFKFYPRRYYLHVIPTLLRRGLPLRTFDTAMDLAANGVPVSRALTCVLVSSGVIVVSEGLYEGGNYHEVWHSSPTQEQARLMMHEAGNTLAATHNAGYVHRNCTWNSLLWSEQQCFLVDLEQARKPRFRRARHRAYDLACVAVEAESAAVPVEVFDEFVQAYVELTKIDRAAVLAGVQPVLEKLRARYRARGRNLAQPVL
ncbi:MAG: lipopolysaccharide kinase InaA family protein [Gammaproteobacteria bacterium]|nr:lipopolysaccharide kinase InaA family protein [Gammaproteobacteria bacterium]